MFARTNATKLHLPILFNKENLNTQRHNQTKRLLLNALHLYKVKSTLQKQDCS